MSNRKTIKRKTGKMKQKENRKRKKKLKRM